MRLKLDLTSEARCIHTGLLKTSRVFTQHHLEPVALFHKKKKKWCSWHGDPHEIRFIYACTSSDPISDFSECQKKQMWSLQNPKYARLNMQHTARWSSAQHAESWDTGQAEWYEKLFVPGCILITVHFMPSNFIWNVFFTVVATTNSHIGSS